MTLNPSRRVFGDNAGLRRLPVRTIINAIADAAERWCDADFGPRVRATRAIEERTGYTEPVIDYALDRLFEALTREALSHTIISELGSLDVLDGFVPYHDGLRTAVGLDRVAIIASRTTIGVALFPAMFALCAKSALIVKDRSDDLTAAFFATLAQERAEFADAARALQWEGGRDPQEHAILAAADAVVAFGNDDTIGAIRSALAPGARFIGFGGRLSAGYVAREALAWEANVSGIALGAATDLVLYDTEGCLSLHLLFVEEDAHIDPTRWCALLADAVAAKAVEFPAGEHTPQMNASRAAFAERARFAAANGTAVLHEAPDRSWTVVLDRGRAWAPPLLPRTCIVLPVARPADALRYVQQHRVPLEGLGLAAPIPRSDLDEFITGSGAAQVRPLGALQRPTAGVRHGGRPRIGEFIRWIDRTTKEQ